MPSRLMSTTRTTMLVASALMVGALGVATVGMAGPSGAATPTGSASTAQAHPQLCARAQHRRAKGGKLVAAFTKREAGAQRLEAKAQAHGHSVRAAYLARIAAHDKSVLSRAQKRLEASEARVAGSAARRCSPPAHSSTSKGTGGSTTS